MPKKIFIFFTLVITASGAIFYFQYPQKEVGSTPYIVKPIIPSLDGLTKPKLQSVKQEGSPSEITRQDVETWAGTEIDGELKVDENGQLIIDRQLRDYFDYMLSAVGDLEPQAVFNIMSAYAHQQIPAPAVEEMMALLDDYLAFKESALILRSTRLIAHTEQTPAYHYRILQDTFEELKLLRRTHMSVEAVGAFFADEEIYTEYSLEKIRISQTADLSPEQKQQKLSELVWILPQEIQESIIRKQRHQQNVEKSESVIKSSLSELEKRHQLSQLYPETVTERIMQHQSNKANLRQRFDRYQQERQVLQSRHASNDELQALLLRYFPTAQEQAIARTFIAQQ
ncbi:lipase secretion chaperone [Maricurvus nonylphenolicus]|uniref:lipase secretion chaperone n=1 Tax=Maricurvus nonylphenolicus TaxID=1008307 RepID=UPI0036F196E7